MKNGGWEWGISEKVERGQVDDLNSVKVGKVDFLVSAMDCSLLNIFAQILKDALLFVLQPSPVFAAIK